MYILFFVVTIIVTGILYFALGMLVARRRGKSALDVVLTDPDWPEKLRRLKEQLANTPDTDPTMVGILALMDAFVRTELEPTVHTGLDDAEVHRLRGRLGMLLDFKRELTKVWQDAKRTAKAKDA